MGRLPFVRLVVHGPDGAATADGVFRLPVTLGRGANCTLTIPGAGDAVSRQHARLDEDSQGNLLLEDLSLNGTEHGGRTINKTSIQIGEVDRFCIVGHDVYVSRANGDGDEAIVARLRHENEGEIARIGPCFMIGVEEAGGVQRLEVAPFKADQATLLEGYRQAGIEPIFVIVPAGRNCILFVTAAGERHGIRHSGMDLKAHSQLNLAPGDRLDTGTFRIVVDAP